MLKIRSAGQIYSQAHLLKNSSNQKLIYSQAHLLTSSSTQKLINLRVHQLKNSPTQKLKLLSFILQHHSNFRTVLAKI